MSSQPEQRGRRSYLSAPPLTQSEHVAEAAEVIRESPGSEGIVLAGALRDLMLWLDTPESDRQAAFDRDAPERRIGQIRVAGLDEGLWVPTLTLAGLTEDPCGVDRPRLLHACQRIIAWAEERGYPATKLAFTQAAALLRPRDANLALEVARLARELGDHPRAESWFRHTVRLTRANNWETYVWAYVGLGVLYIQTGNLFGAKTVIMRALKTATRHGLRPLAGVAHHELFHLAAEAGQTLSASEHILAALKFYGAGHPRLPYLVSDVGWFWLQMGQYTSASNLFERVLPVFTKTNERAMVSANSTWAASAGGDRDRYERLRTRTIEFIRDAQGRSHLDHAYAGLAYADLLMCEWERAAETADQALLLSLATGNAEVRFKAGAIRDNALAQQLPTNERHSPESAVFARHTSSLASELVTMLGATPLTTP